MIVCLLAVNDVLAEEDRPSLQPGRIATTIGDMPGPVTDVRAGILRRRYHKRFGGEELPVPIEAIAEDVCGLAVEEIPDLDVSGMLIPAERHIYLNGTEPPERRRFTLAHEVGHWVCQCLEGTEAPVYCRAEEVGLGPAVKALEREANVFAAELLMPEPAVRVVWDELRDVDAVAKCLDVSSSAVGWRLFNLGMTSERPE